MKEKYIKKIFEANKLAMQCRKINDCGASITPITYMAAYNDFQEITGTLTSLIYCIDLISALEKCLSKYKEDTHFDRDSIVAEISYNENKVEEYFDKLKTFVEKRGAEKWA